MSKFLHDAAVDDAVDDDAAADDAAADDARAMTIPQRFLRKRSSFAKSVSPRHKMREL